MKKSLVLTAIASILPFSPNLWANSDSVLPPENVPQIVPNRTLPKFEPPQAGLRFSAQPTAQEFLRVRLFREASVPIGSAPGAMENQLLVKALLEYSQGPNADDSSGLTGLLRKQAAYT